MANSVWGLILARYVSPALVAVALALGSFAASGLFARIDELAVQQTVIMTQLTAQQNRITAIEARRDANADANDDQTTQILDAQKLTQQRLDSVSTQLAGVSAKV